MIRLAWLFTGIGGTFTIFNFINSFPPAQRHIAYTLNSWFPNAKPDPMQLVELRWRGLIDQETFDNEMKAYGFDKDYAKKLYLLGRNILDVTGLLEAWRRGLITDAKLENELRNRGYDTSTIYTLRSLAFTVPSPSDLIRMTVREVFNPEIAEKFGQFQEFPDEKDIEIAYRTWSVIGYELKRKEEQQGTPLTESQAREVIDKFIEKLTPQQKMIVWALMSGVDPKVLKMYWASHWELPSLSAGYEMLHRLRPELVDFKAEDYKKMGLDPEKLKFTLDDLKLLLKAQDVMPFWRDKLTAISYALPTRVDLRRMLRDGIITEKEAHKYYMMLGYTDKDAWNLVKLAKTMYKEDFRDLTRELILKAYRLEDLSREEAKRMLKGIGYREEDAEFILHVEDIDKKQEELDAQIETAVRKYVYGLIDELELTKRLDEIGVTASRRDLIVNYARLEKEQRIRTPSKTDVLNWYRSKLITEKEAKEWLRQLGYPDKVVNLYIKAEKLKCKGG